MSMCPPKFETASAKEETKKLKYLKYARNPRLVEILIQNQNFFMPGLLASNKKSIIPTSVEIIACKQQQNVLKP